MYRHTRRRRPGTRQALPARGGHPRPPFRQPRRRSRVRRGGRRWPRGPAGFARGPDPADGNSDRRRGGVRRLEIVQLGLGHVGRAVAQIVLEERKRWLEVHGIEVRYRAVSDTSGALVGEELLPKAIRLKEEGGKLAELGVEPLEDVLS